VIQIRHQPGRPSEPPPPTLYQVLGVSRHERDPRVLEEAALGRTGRIRAYQLTCEEDATRLLNEVALALLTLLDPVRRRHYDHSLDLPGQVIQPAQSRQAGEARTCDVRVVCRGRMVL
jgi:hypothetical protein